MKISEDENLLNKDLKKLSKIKWMILGLASMGSVNIFLIISLLVIIVLIIQEHYITLY